MSHFPEGVLRSSFLPMNTKGGTALFLSYEKGWYRIHSRFENYARRKNIDNAVKIFEEMELGTRIPE